MNRVKTVNFTTKNEIKPVHSTNETIKDDIKKAIEKYGISKDSVTVLKGKFDYASAKKQLKEYYAEVNSFDFDTIISLNDDMAFACIDFTSVSIAIL